MKRRFRLSVLVLLPLFLAAAFTWPDAAVPVAGPEVGKAAPAFTLPGTDGETYTLSDLKGKYVVLEWLNFGCPYVQRHYKSGNMTVLQEKYTEQGVVWLSVVSSAPGEQGHYPADEMNAINKGLGGRQTAILLDPEGDVGMAYGAQTTPQMFVIDPKGTLLYMGGIDDKPRASLADTPKIPNYVDATLEAVMNGKAVAVTSSQPYGCSVKYAR